MSDWTSARIFGVSPIFWIGVGLTVLLSVGLRYTAVGRRFQSVGANPTASQVVGVRVTVNQILVYVVAAVFYAIAGVALAGLLRTPGVAVGSTYLLGPIAAVVIGGASLTGGLASPMSTFAAALFLTGLNQMLRTMGLPTALQFVVFGVVIIGGMLVSGDRIVRGVEQLIRERRRPDRSQTPTIPGGTCVEGGGYVTVSQIREHLDDRLYGRRNMQRFRIIGFIAVLALVAAACGGDEETPGGTPTPDRSHRERRAVGLRGEHRCRPGLGGQGPRARRAVR